MLLIFVMLPGNIPLCPRHTCFCSYRLKKLNLPLSHLPPQYYKKLFGEIDEFSLWGEKWTQCDDSLSLRILRLLLNQSSSSRCNIPLEQYREKNHPTPNS